MQRIFQQKMIVKIFLLSVFVAECCYAADIPQNSKDQSSENPDLVRFERELGVIIKNIELSQAESQQFTGGAIKSSLELSIATRRNAKVRVANNIRIVKACIGKTATTDSNNFKHLTEEIDSINREIDLKQRTADGYGNGMIRATITSTIATMENTRTLLEEQLVQEKYKVGCLE